MESIMKPWYAILTLAISFACFLLGRYSVEKRIEVVKETDTINEPILEPSYVFDVEEIELPYPVFVYQKGDTVKELDTIYVPLPIQRKVYETDLYRAVVSGYRPNLDSMTIYHKREIIHEKDRRWGIGITAGYGIGKYGLSPYVGIGGFYRIW